MSDDDNKDKGKAPVYVSFATFKNVIDALSKSLPNQVDRTAFVGQSGGVQSQLLAGFRFMALIDGAGKPTKDLVALTAGDENARKAALKQILHTRYAPLFAIKLEGATIGQLADAMSTHYSVSSETKEKAIRFFLSACRYAGVPLSSWLMKANTVPVQRKRRARPASEVKLDPVVPPPPTGNTPPPPAGNGQTRTVRLKSGGGEVTVSMAIDMFALDDYDDTWVRKLIEHFRGYSPGTPVDDEDDFGGAPADVDDD